MKTKPRDPKLFAEEYAKDLNARDAYIRAFGTSSNNNSAAANASRYMKDPRVKEAVAEATKRRTDKVGFDAERVLEEIAKIAFSDVSELFDEGGNLKPITKIDRQLAKAIQAFEVVSKQKPTRKGEPIEFEYTYKIKLWDKLGALDKLGRHLKLFMDYKPIGDEDGGMPLSGVMMSDLELARRIAFLLSKPLSKKKQTT